MNLRNLERVLAREEEVKRRAIVHKTVFNGPQIRYISKNGRIFQGIMIYCLWTLHFTCFLDLLILVVVFFIRLSVNISRYFLFRVY